MLDIKYVCPESGKVLHLSVSIEHAKYTVVIQEFINFLRGLGYIIPQEYDTV